jgi:hypothetical protein
MTKEQFLDMWRFGSNPLFEADLNAVIAHEIEKAKGVDKPTTNPIREAYDAYKPIREKDWPEREWAKKHSEGHSIGENGRVYNNFCIDFDFDTHPERWEIYTEAEADQVTDQDKPKFDQDRFERVFCALLVGDVYVNAIKGTEDVLSQLDAYYASKKGGSNG